MSDGELQESFVLYGSFADRRKDVKKDKTNAPAANLPRARIVLYLWYSERGAFLCVSVKELASAGAGKTRQRSDELRFKLARVGSREDVVEVVGAHVCLEAGEGLFFEQGKIALADDEGEASFA